MLLSKHKVIVAIFEGNIIRHPIFPIEEPLLSLSIGLYIFNKEIVVRGGKDRREKSSNFYGVGIGQFTVYEKIRVIHKGESDTKFCTALRY